MSEFHVRVIRVEEIFPHTNADRLEIVMVDGGYPVVVSKGEFKLGDLAVYLPIDSIVPDTEDYSFLIPQETVQPTPLTSGVVPAIYLTQPKYQVGDVPEKYRRIKAKKIRGIFSMGMLRPLPSGGKNLRVGDDVQDLMGVEKWDPDADIEGMPRAQNGGLTARRGAYSRLPWYRKPLNKIFWGRLKWDFKKKLGLVPTAMVTTVAGPGNFPEYTDIESLRKHGKWLSAGEPVVITEKIHGANARFGWTGGRFWVGSHHQFKARPIVGQKVDIFWRAALDADLERKLSVIPDIALFGEVYGTVQKGFSYDAPGKLRVRFFDALNLKTRRYLDFKDFVEMCDRTGLEWAPVLFTGPWSEDLRSLADGKSTMGSHIREGIVIRPLQERYQPLPHGGRVVLKLVGEAYLLKAA